MAAMTNARTHGRATVIDELEARFAGSCRTQTCADGIPTVWIDRDRIIDAMRFLKYSVAKPYPLLFDLSAIDERLRTSRADQPPSDFTVFYHLMSLERNEDVRIKVALPESACAVPSIVSIYPVANWYEREAFDMFGIRFRNHPNLKRILMWDGYPYFPLRKDFPLAGIPTELPDTAVDADSVRTAPMLGGPFVTTSGTNSSVRREPRQGDTVVEHQERLLNPTKQEQV